MKKIKTLLGSLALAIVLISTVAAAQNSVTLSWNPVTNASVNGYNVYSKLTTASSWATNAVPGVNTTSLTLGSLVVGGVYQFYVTSTTTNAAIESDPSTQIRYQQFVVNGNKPTPLTLGDLTSTNFVSFLLVSSPTNGTVIGPAPNVSFNPTVSFASAGKDLFVYRNPEQFGGGNVTNYYSVYKTDVLPPVSLKVTPN
jgi:hypothetical protein